MDDVGLGFHCGYREGILLRAEAKRFRAASTGSVPVGQCYVVGWHVAWHSAEGGVASHCGAGTRVVRGVEGLVSPERANRAGAVPDRS